jgi:hypothetical protein
MTVGNEMAVFWDAAPCSIVDTEHDDGGIVLFRNVGQYLPDYVVLHTGRQPFMLLAARSSNLTEQ